MLNLFKRGPSFSFNVLVQKSEESDKWLAICLELDIVVEGNNPHEAEKNLQASIQMYLESVFEQGDFESLWRPAPAEYWEKLRKTKPKASLNLVSA